VGHGKSAMDRLSATPLKGGVILGNIACRIYDCSSGSGADVDSKIALLQPTCMNRAMTNAKPAKSSPIMIACKCSQRIVVRASICTSNSRSSGHQSQYFKSPPFRFKYSTSLFTISSPPQNLTGCHRVLLKVSVNWRILSFVGLRRSLFGI
jgi:hypothetical protein